MDHGHIANLTHVPPAHFGNVNFRGALRFPLERYRDRLLGSAARSRLLTLVGGRAQ